MGKVYLLDCTLRDGGYINDWNFGEDTLKGFCRKIAQTGIEIFETGFLRGDEYDPNRSVFPDIQSITKMISPRSDKLMYTAMLDIRKPVPIERLIARDKNTVDAIRVIFKKDKINEAYEYGKRVQELGYKLFFNFVGTDQYTDKEFIEGIEKLNPLKPFAMAIVDSYGLIKRKQFLRLVYLADNNMAEGITLCYHAHNNLQQASGNAEALVEMNLKRDICIDACVFGMGKGAGNLNLELFADYMNENFDTSYRTQPMLEIIDEYLNDIYRRKSWGYSLPFYLSAITGCDLNYAIFLAQKDSLTVKSFNEFLRSIPQEDKAAYSLEKAESFYRNYQENFIDDKAAVAELSKRMEGKRVLLIAPGRSISEYEEEIYKLKAQADIVTIAVNFCAEKFSPDYIFSSNMRRYRKIQGKTQAVCITTSNMKDCTQTDFVVNFSTYAMVHPEIIDNSGLMTLKLLENLGVNQVIIAGMDGYSTKKSDDYFDENLEFDFSKQAGQRNDLISNELKKLGKKLKISFITPTNYDI